MLLLIRGPGNTVVLLELLPGPSNGKSVELLSLVTKILHVESGQRKQRAFRINNSKGSLFLSGRHGTRTRSPLNGYIISNDAANQFAYLPVLINS